MRHNLFVSVSVFFFAGCSVHPLPEDLIASRKNTYEIVQAIRCEAKRGVLEFAKDARFKGAIIGYSFDFNITEDNEASAGLTVQKKFTDGSVFKVPWSGGTAIKKREAVRQFTVIDKFDDLQKADCGGIDVASKNLAYPITGSIGLYEVVTTFSKIETQTNFLVLRDFKGLENNVAAFSDTLTFTTELKSGSLKPELTLESIPTGKIVVTAASIGGSSGRKDVHSVTVALSLAKGAEAALGKSAGAVVSPKTRDELKRFSNSSPLVTFTRSPTITDIDVQSADDATARVLLELARRRQVREVDQRLQLLLELTK
jgi:hypothetical protein